MKKIKFMNKIAKIGTDKLDKTKYECGDNVENPDAIMVRSAVLHEMEFNKNLVAIARAGAGVNNIPIDRCSENGIVVFNTPGANANGVKELAICALLLASRDVVGGIDWVKTLEGTTDVAKQVETGKSKFAGHEVMGKTLGVIGLGAIGGMVANTAEALGMDVEGCDPFLSVDAAWGLSRKVKKANTYEEIYKNADYITLHVPATKDTKNMINKNTIALMKDGVKIINLSRADLVNAEDLKAALESGKVAKYVTDFPTEEILGAKNVIAIPHLGASTEESEDNCAVMAAIELDDYLTNGNIKNSVNFPNMINERTMNTRVCVLHANVPSVLQQITGIFGNLGINIENCMNKSKGDYAYSVLDVESDIGDDVVNKIKAIDGIKGVRVIE